MTAPQLWVRSDVLPDGTYGITINVGDDDAWTLTPERAVQHAAGCAAVATTACHDTAVIAALSAPGGPFDKAKAAAFVVHEVRPGRHPDVRTAPLQFEPGVSTFTGRPFVAMHLHGRPVGQLDPAQLRDHAVGVLGAVAAAALDQHIADVLVRTVGAAPREARGFVSDLAQHWPEEGTDA